MTERQRAQASTASEPWIIVGSEQKRLPLKRVRMGYGEMANEEGQDLVFCEGDKEPVYSQLFLYIGRDRIQYPDAFYMDLVGTPLPGAPPDVQKHVKRFKFPCTRQSMSVVLHQQIPSIVIFADPKGPFKNDLDLKQMWTLDVNLTSSQTSETDKSAWAAMTSQLKRLPVSDLAYINLVRDEAPHSLGEALGSGSGASLWEKVQADRELTWDTGLSKIRITGALLCKEFIDAFEELETHGTARQDSEGEDVEEDVQVARPKPDSKGKGKDKGKGKARA